MLDSRAENRLCNSLLACRVVQKSVLWNFQGPETLKPLDLHLTLLLTGQNWQLAMIVFDAILRARVSPKARGFGVRVSSVIIGAYRVEDFVRAMAACSFVIVPETPKPLN